MTELLEIAPTELSRVVGGEGTSTPSTPTPSTWDRVKSGAQSVASEASSIVKGCAKGATWGLISEPTGRTEREFAALCSGEWIGPVGGVKHGVRRALGK
jgi:hypothetical protein